MKITTYEHYLRNKEAIDKAINKGVVFFYRDSKIKQLIGKCLIVYGFVTLPLPTGSIIAIGTGCFMVGFKGNIKQTIKTRLRYEVNKRR